MPLGPLFLSLDLCLPWGFSCLTFVLSFPVPAAPSSLLLSSASLVCPPTAPIPLSNLFEILSVSAFWVQFLGTLDVTVWAASAGQ